MDLKTQVLSYALLAAFFQTGFCQTNPRQQRTWTSRSGEFSVEAKFVKSDSDSVIIQRKDNNKRITVELDDLSSKDRRFVVEAMGLIEKKRAEVQLYKDEASKTKREFRQMRIEIRKRFEEEIEPLRKKVAQQEAKRRNGASMRNDGSWLQFDWSGQHGGHIVNGKNGPYYRSYPNGSTADNWSSRGNVNPYTGKKGYKR